MPPDLLNFQFVHIRGICEFGGVQGVWWQKQQEQQKPEQARAGVEVAHVTRGQPGAQIQEKLMTSGKGQ